MKSDKLIKIWLLTGCAMIVVMVLIGGITRLTDSGLSITEWDVIKGSIPPIGEEAWNEAFDKYKQIPEFQLRHSHFDLQDFKRIFFWEYIHRLWGRIMGLVFFFPFAWLWYKKKWSPRLKRRGIIILLGGGAVGALGWFMVSSGLSENPDVSHYRLAIHLVAAFSLFSFVYWTYLLLQSNKAGVLREQLSKPLKYSITIAIMLLGLQIVYGAFTAGLDAGLMYNTWPLMNGSFVPENLAPFDSTIKNLTDHKDGVQFIHRNMALILGVLTFFIAFKLKAVSLTGKTWFWLVVLVLLQITLGICTLIDAKNGDISVFWGTFHQLGALFLLIQYLNLAFKTWAKPLD